MYSKSSTSKHNVSVQQTILKEITSHPDSEKYSQEVVKGYLINTQNINYVCITMVVFLVAIRRCYENLRRSFNENQKENAHEYTEKQSRRRKYRSRRQRVSLCSYMNINRLWTICVHALAAIWEEESRSNRKRDEYILEISLSGIYDRGIRWPGWSRDNCSTQTSLEIWK